MPPKECPPGKILNPATNRCVKIDGKIGRALAKAAASPKRASTPKKERILRDISSKCNNDADPISMDAFSDMTEEQLESLVFIGNGAKKNCYLLENIYELYKTAVMSKKPATDPMDPSHKLTDDEINKINSMMKARDSSYTSPKYVTPRPYPKEYRLEIQPSTHHENYFVIKVMRNNRVKFNLGIVPGWVETHHTGSADNTSGVLLSNIRELWDRKVLMTPDGTNYSCCAVELGRTYTYWRGSQWKARFISLCESIRDRLADS